MSKIMSLVGSVDLFFPVSSLFESSVYGEDESRNKIKENIKGVKKVGWEAIHCCPGNDCTMVREEMKK